MSYSFFVTPEEPFNYSDDGVRWFKDPICPHLSWCLSRRDTKIRLYPHSETSGAGAEYKVEWYFRDGFRNIQTIENSNGEVNFPLTFTFDSAKVSVSHLNWGPIYPN